MAQQDTGLGWSANEEWLLQGSGAIADITSGSGQLPVFNNPSKLDIELNGVTLWLNPNNGQWCKAVAGSPGVYGFAWETSTALNPGAIAADNTAVFYYAYSYSKSVLTKTINGAVPNHSGWYFGNVSQGITTSVNPTTDVPVYEAASQGDAAGLAVDDILSMSFQITKSNMGYAVACVVKWKTQNGTELISPILISSNSDYVEMAATSASYNLAKFNGLLDGVRFYMGFWDIPGGASVTSSLQTLDLTERGNLDLQTLFMILISTNNAHVIIINSPDPYEEQTGDSGEEGGDGDDIVDDDVDFTPLPSSMAVASGFITLFCPSQYELNQLANYMWGPLFDVDTFKKLFANPMDCILGLAVYPFPISASGTKTVSVGGIATTVSMGYTLQQYHIVDCGSVYVPKQWGAYMDYAPYTKFNIFLPYIGFRPISADDIMGKTISLRYMVDILSGACNAELKCGSTVLYSWAGSCAAQIPITGNDWRSAITAGISIAGSVAATVLTQGASAPMIAGTVASATVNSMQLKPEVQRSGSISGSSGFLAGQRPYIVRTNPRSAIPANQNKYSGYPSFVTILLGSLTGYNEVYSVHLENIPATGAELDEIESILKGGAIF